MTGVLQGQELEFSFSLGGNQGQQGLVCTEGKRTHVIRRFLRSKIIQLLCLLRQQLGLLRGMLSLGLETTPLVIMYICQRGKTYLVISLDGPQLGLDALVSFLFLQEPQSSLVFDPRELCVFLLRLEFFL